MIKLNNRKKKIKNIATIWLEASQLKKGEKNHNSILYWKKRIRPSN